MSRHPYQKRLLKEYQSLSRSQLPGITLVSSDDNLTSYIFQLRVSNHTLYPSNYYLSIKITDEYPVDSPLVKFIKYADISADLDETRSDDVPTLVIPVHPHIYSNGHICLNLLGDDWTPACSIESILLSIQSMLDTNVLDERPPDNDNYVSHAPEDPKRTRFIYHDDNV